MENYLTQEEINDLLDAIRSGEIDLDAEGSGDAASDRGVEKLDLFRGQGAGRGRIANFDIILDAFARHCGISQANRLKQTVSVKRVAIETEVFENFVRNLQEHGVIAILRFEPLESGGLLILDSTLAFGLIEIMLGATTEDNLYIPDREMSIIEMNILQDVIKDICADWEKAFEPLEEEMDCSLVQVETNPRMVNIVTPDTEVLVSRFSVNAGNLFGQMSIVMPYFALEPYKEQLKNRMLNIASLVGSRTWASELKSELVQVKTQVSAQFGELSMSLRQILNLQEGDILTLDQDRDDPVEILVGDKPKFQGVAGSRKGKKAIRVTGVKNVWGGDYDVEGHGE